MPEDQLAALPLELRQMVMTGATALGGALPPNANPNAGPMMAGMMPMDMMGMGGVGGMNGGVGVGGMNGGEIQHHHGMMGMQGPDGGMGMEMMQGEQGYGHMMGMGGEFGVGPQVRLLSALDIFDVGAEVSLVV